MFGNIFGDMYDVCFEVWIEDKLTNKQQMQAPKEMSMINFVQTAQQIKKDSRPIKLKMTRQEIVWDNFENKEKILDCMISISNDAMTAWEENKETKQ